MNERMVNNTKQTEFFSSSPRQWSYGQGGERASELCVSVPIRCQKILVNLLVCRTDVVVKLQNWSEADDRANFVL